MARVIEVDVPAVTGPLALYAFHAGTGLGTTRTGLEYRELYTLYQFARVEGWGIAVTFGDGDSDREDRTFHEQARRLARARPRVESPRPVAVELTGNLISDIRGLSGLTSQQIAEIADVTERTILEWRRHPKQIPERARKLLEGLRAVAATLVGGLGPAGVALWFMSEPEAPARLIKQGRIQEVKQRALSYEDSLGT